jgi:hypothetical protein
MTPELQLAFVDELEKIAKAGLLGRAWRGLKGAFQPTRGLEHYATRTPGQAAASMSRRARPTPRPAAAAPKPLNEYQQAVQAYRTGKPGLSSADHAHYMKRLGYVPSHIQQTPGL